MTRDVQHLLKARNSAFQSGDMQQHTAARANLKNRLRDAKGVYKQKIDGSDPCQAWQGIHHITRQNNTGGTSSESASEAEQLNRFFACFEVEAMTAASPAPVTESWTVVLQPAEVIRSLRKINTWKAAGPDGVPGQVFRDCVPELGEVFKNIFNLSLSQFIVLTWISTIVPLPKQTSITSFNDYMPVGLTPVIMKRFKG